MSTRETLDQLLRTLPDNQIQEVLDFAQFLRMREERQSWASFGREQFARAYGPDEPEYSEADLKSGPAS